MYLCKTVAYLINLPELVQLFQHKPSLQSFFVFDKSRQCYVIEVKSYQTTPSKKIRLNSYFQKKRTKSFYSVYSNITIL